MSERDKSNATTLVALGALGSLPALLPVPILPEKIERMARRWSAERVAQSHGLRLNPAALNVLAECLIGGEVESTARRMAWFQGRKFLGKWARRLGAAEVALRSFRAASFDLMLHVYLGRLRTAREVLIGADEAIRIKEAIEQAHDLVLSPNFRPAGAPRPMEIPELSNLPSVVPAILQRRIESALRSVLEGSP